MASAAIRVENLSKMYRIDVNERQPTSWARSTLNVLGSPFAYLRRMMRPPTDQETLWALRDISFEVERGQVLGLIGHNGAGKSTLLKILSRITDPSGGRAVLHGRVGSLLEVGTGFHQDLTGRENIFLSGTILGMKKNEIDRKLDEIVAFAEVERFLDTPVKRYSSGMSVRLGFAVAAHLEPEILIVDEVLSVGDANFQRKCLGKMNSISKEGRTILFVSHNMPSVQALCERAILLDKGRLVMEGSAGEVIEKYLGGLEATQSPEINLVSTPNRITPSETAVFKRLRLLNQAGKATSIFSLGEKITFELLLDTGRLEFDSPLVTMAIHKQGLLVTNLLSHYMVKDEYRIRGRTRVRCTWDPGGLAPDLYTIQLLVFKKYAGGERIDAIQNAASFEIAPRDIYGTGKLGLKGSLLIPSGAWEFEALSAASNEAQALERG
jgi:lipopolysaccharide transport system ATP-binding protein